MKQYNTPNLDQMQDYLNNKSNGSSGGPTQQWWSIPKGMSSVRILPPWDPTGRIALPVSMHPIEYQGEGMKYKKYNWTCLNKTFGKPCKICEGLNSLSSAGVDISKYEANRTQFYMNVLVMYDPLHEADIKQGKSDKDARGVSTGTMVIMRTPKTIYDWVVSNITNPMIGDITNVEKGIDVYITKEGEGLGTSYTATLSPNGRTPIPKEYLDRIDEIYNLDEVFGAGFEDDQIDKLISSLRGSAGYIANNVPQQVQQMAGYQQNWTNTPGYQQNPPTQYNPLTQGTTTGSIPPFMGSSTTSAPQQTAADQIPINPYAVTPPAPGATPIPAQPVQQSTPDTDTKKPRCFGSYSPSNVSCVVCPMEIPCSKTVQS